MVRPGHCFIRAFPHREENPVAWSTMLPPARSYCLEVMMGMPLTRLNHSLTIPGRGMARPGHSSIPRFRHLLALKLAWLTMPPRRRLFFLVVEVVVRRQQVLHPIWLRH